jgi:hypothetical protein
MIPLFRLLDLDSGSAHHSNDRATLILVYPSHVSTSLFQVNWPKLLLLNWLNHILLLWINRHEIPVLNLLEKDIQESIYKLWIQGLRTHQNRKKLHIDCFSKKNLHRNLMIDILMYRYLFWNPSHNSDTTCLKQDSFGSNIHMQVMIRLRSIFRLLTIIKISFYLC